MFKDVGPSTYGWRVLLVLSVFGAIAMLGATIAFGLWVLSHLRWM